MPKKTVYTEVNGQKLKLSNLEKVLYPDTQITKAQVIQHYLSCADYILKYAGHRPLTLIRYPDGISSKKFYTKNKPDFTPKWIPTTEVPHDKEKDYLYATSQEHIVWLANLAALELHSGISSIQSISNPDQFIIDLDPSPNQDFGVLKTICFHLRDFLTYYGYNSLVKLSGGKGIHIHCPIIPKYSFNQVTTAVKFLLTQFVKDHPNTTLKVHKQNRSNKLLLDIYRNYEGNTAISPFSLRGKPNAPIAMPISWESLKFINSSQHFTLSKFYAEPIVADPWIDFKRMAVSLHSDSKYKKLNKEKLKEYIEKRDFQRTKEPTANVDNSVNGKFVLQLHNASNIHYDLRLGIDGILKSWAIPKGLPLLKDVKRLAIQTEDHPAKYIDFEGIIPEEEYGGGQMWIFDQGSIEWIKKSSKSLKFKLVGQNNTNTYHLYKMKEDDWLLEIIEGFDKPDWEKLSKSMLCEQVSNVPDDSKYLFEVKWDGIRVMIIKNGSDTKIISRNGRDITLRFPEFYIQEFIRVEKAVIDAELVCLDDKGVPVFEDIISRLHSTSNRKISQLGKVKKAYLYCFDCIYLDGKSLTKQSIEQRKEWLNAIIKTSDLVRISEVFENGQMLFQAAKEMYLEGIMAKRKSSTYIPGQRSKQWLKVKFRSTMMVHIIGYTQGKGDRSPYFGALHMAKIENQNFIYLGKVGSGFDSNKLKEIKKLLEQCIVIRKPIKEPIEEPKNTTWIESQLICEVEYASLSSNGSLREPIFVKLRLDL